MREQSISEYLRALLARRGISQSQLEGPSDTRDYQAAVRDWAIALRDTYRETGADIAAAVSESDIEAGNAAVGIVNQREEARVLEAAEGLSGDSSAALNAITRCGGWGG